MKAIALVLAFLSSSTAAQPSFVTIGDLPGGLFGSVALDISADGRTAVGSSFSSTQFGFDLVEGFRWTSDDGMMPLGLISGNSVANSVSASGEWIAGFTYEPGVSYNKGVVWDTLRNSRQVQNLPGGLFNSVAAISNNGIAIGYAHYKTNTSQRLTQAFRWTSAGGTEPLGFVGSDTESNAFDISADGTIIAGHSQSGDWIWTEQSGITPAGTDGFRASALTNDGTFLVGSVSHVDPILTTTKGGIWSISTGTIELDSSGLGTLWDSMSAHQASFNAEVIIGSVQLSPEVAAPFIWLDRGSHGMLFSDYLRMHGLDLSSLNYRINRITSISDDGMTFSATVTNPNGFSEAAVISIPAPTTASILALGLFATRRKR